MAADPNPNAAIQITNASPVYVALNNPTLATAVADQISCFGYQPQIFTESDALQQAILQHNPHALVIDTDFTSGELSGANMVEKLQTQLPQFLPVIFVSSRGDLNTRLAAVRAHGLAFMNEPVRIASVVENLDALNVSSSPEPFRVLIVEDSRSQALYFAKTLYEAGMKVEVVSQPQNLLTTLVDFQPDLILMDLHLPECTGIELANIIRQQESYVSVPIVFLSSDQDVHQQLDALSLGADDFLTKPVEPYYLITAVRSRAHRARILRTLMVRDGLTGLLNHTYLFELLEIQVSRACRSAQPLCFAMIDLDLFKQVNDRYGHPVGDRVLKSLATLLQQRLRKTDTIGRYGGEEFAIILPDTDVHAAEIILNEILRAFSALKHSAAETEFSVSFSAGIAALAPNDNPSTITKRADQAMYKAKAQGRNQVVVA